jgi:hypothetical protein
MTDNMGQRQQTMQRDVLLVATAGASLINGQGFSPFFDPIFFLLRPFVAGTFFATPLVFFYLTSLFLSLMTLLIAGLPAALYERARGHSESTPISIGIWFVLTFLLSIPAMVTYYQSG